MRGSRPGPTTCFRSARQPFAPCDFIEPDRDAMAKSDERLFQHARFFAQAPEPPVVGMHGTVQAKVVKASRFTVHQTRYAEPFRESSELSQRGSAFLKIHEMSDDAALSEEPQGLSGVCALARPENLDLESLGCCAGHMRLITMVGPGGSRRARVRWTAPNVGVPRVM